MFEKGTTCNLVASAVCFLGYYLWMTALDISREVLDIQRAL